MTRIEQEVKRRINLAVWAYAYEFKAVSLVSDAVFDEESKKVDLSIRTSNPVLDQFFAEYFVDYSGVWVRNHPDLQGLERIYQLKLASRREPMNLTEYVSAAGVLSEAFSHPSMRVSARSSRRPDLDTALKSVVAAIEYSFVRNISEIVELKLEEAMEQFVLINGEHKNCPTAKAQNEWESACDDMVEQAIEEYEQYLSADWLGKNMVQTDLHKAGQLKKFCDKLGFEHYRQLTHGQQPAAIMLSAGITAEMVNEHLMRHNNPTEQEQEEMSADENEELDNVIAKIAAHVGPDHDILAVYDDLDLASDDDDILASGAAARLGLEPSDVPVLQAERMVVGKDVAEHLHERLKAALASGATPKPAKKPAAAKTPAKAEKPAGKGSSKKAAAAAAPAEAEALGTFVFATLRECGLADAELATGMRVSRPTANNWINGKSECKPSPEQMAFIRDQIAERIGKLQEAQEVLDGASL